MVARLSGVTVPSPSSTIGTSCCWTFATVTGTAAPATLDWAAAGVRPAVPLSAYTKYAPEPIAAPVTRHAKAMLKALDFMGHLLHHASGERSLQPAPGRRF